MSPASASVSAGASARTPTDNPFRIETVLSVRHWTPHYFSLRTSRDPGLRFESGQFVMLGMVIDGRPLLRAYSIASGNWEDELEFFSIKVGNGQLTSRLQHVQPGDELLVSRKPTGTLLIFDVEPGRNLYLLASGTGLALFLSIIRDPEIYSRYDKVILTHGVREIADLAYREEVDALHRHEYLGEMVRDKLLYYPAVSREHFSHRGRLTELLESGQLMRDLGLPPLDARYDRAMICGSPQMLADFRRILDLRGMRAAARIGSAGQYVFERAFVDK